MKLVISTDGASSGNPGPMGLGIVIYKGAKMIEEHSLFAGKGTNNMAEYLAVIKALEAAKKLKAGEVHLKSDSQLLVRQLSGEYKVKNAKLKPLKAKVDELCEGIKVFFEHVPREKNKEADKLSKDAVKRYRKRMRKR